MYSDGPCLLLRVVGIPPPDPRLCPSYSDGPCLFFYLPLEVPFQVDRLLLEPE